MKPTVAEGYLAVLAANGVDYLFANAGTDFPPIVEALARARSTGAPSPRAVVVAHEQTAMSMAHGYWLITGRTQAVMVHVSVGTANAVCGLMNAARENVPILLTAGRSPLTESGYPGSRSAPIHWAQEMFDQAGMVRELVKWDYQIAGGHELNDIVTRALAIADSEPKGPVYLSLPREALAQPHDGGIPSGAAPIVAATAPKPDLSALREVANLIASAKAPLVIAGRVGKDPAAAHALARLADDFALPVVEFWSSYLGLASDHPMHVGYDIDAEVGSADLVVALDCDVPWLPDHAEPSGDCRVIHIGPDPLFSTYPVRNFRTDIALTSTCLDALTAIEVLLSESIDRTAEDVVRRRDKITKRHNARRAQAASSISTPTGPSGRMTKEYITREISRAKADDAIVFNEYPLRRDFLEMRHPGTFFDQCSAAGLGWGLGAALGAKLARPDRQVIAALGDGSYIFANPTASHQVAQALGLPILIVIFNNARWDAVRSSTAWMYPTGEALGSDEVPLTSLHPSPAYELYAQASGGYGARVERPDELAPALRDALQAVAAGQHALLNVLCD